MRVLRTFARSAALAALFALAGASPAHADAEKPAPLSPVQAEQLLAFFGELVDNTVKHAADCGGLAKAVDGVISRHISTVEMSWAAKKAKQTLPPDIQAKMDKRALELVGALRRCWTDDNVKAAFKRMKVPEDKKP